MQTIAGELHLEISKVGSRIKIGAYESLPGEKRTVTPYDELFISPDSINARCQEIVETLNTANRRGQIAPDVFSRLQEIGQVFADDLLSGAVKAKLRSSQAQHLILTLDDQVVHIPWELLHDGRQFLCQRFSIGRVVKTRQLVPSNGIRNLSAPFKMLIMADPSGDLKEAYSEGVRIRDFTDSQKQFIHAYLRTGNITPEFVKERIRSFDIVHFAGHADYVPDQPEESGWRLTSGRFKAQEIMKMTGTCSMPSLIFSNACQSARTEEWKLKESFHDEIFGLANAFILAGVRHYIGTFWEIPDEPGKRFALEFYAGLFSGASVGQSIRQARLKLMEAYGEQTIVWAGYLLYGDPSYTYVSRIPNGHPAAASDALSSISAGPKRSPEYEIRGAQHPAPETHGLSKQPTDAVPSPNIRPKSPIMFGFFLIALLLIIGYGYMEKKDTVHPKQPLQSVVAVNQLDDTEKQKKVDQLIHELSLRRNAAPPKPADSDSWSSQRLTMWVMDIEVMGHSVQEGEDRLIASGIQKRLLNHSRIEIVERKAIDALLKELNLGTSEISDPTTLLVLGRLLAARLMVTGNLMMSEAEKQVSLRLIETETGKIVAAMIESFPIKAPVSLISDQIAEQLVEKIETLYPLRARIAEINADQITLNIGSNTGLRVGQMFRVVGADVMLETVSLFPDTALVRKTAGTANLTKGLRAEAVYQ